MGNVFAASGPAGGSFAAPDPPPPSGLSGGDEKNHNEWPNPGVMEDLHKRTKGEFCMFSFYKTTTVIDFSVVGRNQTDSAFRF